MTRVFCAAVLLEYQAVRRTAIAQNKGSRIKNRQARGGGAKAARIYFSELAAVSIWHGLC